MTLWSVYHTLFDVFATFTVSYNYYTNGVISTLHFLQYTFGLCCVSQAPCFKGLLHVRCGTLSSLFLRLWMEPFMMELKSVAYYITCHICMDTP